MDDYKAGVQFVNHEYDYRQNYMTWSPVTNLSKLWQNLRKKLDIGYMFSEEKKQELTLQNARQHCMLKGLTNDGLIVNK